MDQLLLHDVVPFYYVDPAAYQYYYPYYNEPQIEVPPMEVHTVIHGDKYDDLIKIVWQREFNRLFAQMPNQTIGKWNFYHVGSGEQQASHYYQLRDWAKVRFSCAQCGNGWTSMRGMVQFDVEIALITQPEGVSLTARLCHFALNFIRSLKLATFMRQCMVRNVKSALMSDSSKRCGIPKR